MRLAIPLLRFRLRTLLIVVAVIALALGGWRLWERRTRFLDEASQNAMFERLSREYADQPLGVCNLTPTTGDVYRRMDAERRAWNLAQADHYARLRAKYERAARSPWLPVEPDPPPPE